MTRVQIMPPGLIDGAGTSQSGAVRSTTKKGKIGEIRVRALLARAGWMAGLQPGFGAPGTRSGNRSRQGDVWAHCGEARLRIEVKHYKREPRVLQTLRGGCEVLAYACSETDRLAVFIDEGLFCDLLSWAADSLGQHPSVSAARRGGVVDGEIARARLEEIVAEADYPFLIDLAAYASTRAKGLRGRVPAKSKMRRFF